MYSAFHKCTILYKLMQLQVKHHHNLCMRAISFLSEECREAGLHSYELRILGGTQHSEPHAIPLQTIVQSL